MNTIIVSKTKFKPKTFEYLRKVENHENTILLTDHGCPVAEIVPYGQPAINDLKKMRGLIIEYIDPTEPLDEKWDADL